MKSRDVVVDVTNRRAIGTFLYRLPIGQESLNRLVSEIFSIKVADTQTDTSTDNKGRLKASSARANIARCTHD